MGESIIAMSQESDPSSEVSRFEETIKRASQLVGRAALAVGLLAGSTVAAYSAENALNEQPAAASTDDYPDKDAYYCGPGPYDWCKNGRMNSPRNYDYRNCTDWAAWRVKQITGQAVPAGLGHAGTWDDRAPSWAEVDTSPEVGDVAVWNSSSYGHVAVVETVNKDGSVNISEYNYQKKGAYGTRPNVRAHRYIDFTPAVNEGAKLPAAGSGSSSGSEGKRSDFNGSGLSDLLLYQTGSGNDHLLYGRVQKGDFAHYRTSLNGIYHMATGDFNGDGRGDVLAYGRGVDPDYVFYGGGKQGEQSKVQIAIRGNYEQIVPGDFNGDKIDDIFLYGAGSNEDKVMSGTNQLGVFHRDDTTPVNGNYELSSGDYNSDGRDDLFLYGPHGNDHVFVGRVNRGEFGIYPMNPPINGVYARPVSGDYNGDGFDDVLLHGPGNMPDRLFYGTGNPGGYNVQKMDIHGSYLPIATGDYNGDGFDDVVLHGPGTAQDRVLYGTSKLAVFDSVEIVLNGSYQRVST